MSIIRGYLNQTGQVKRTAAAVFFDGPAAASLEPLLITGIGGDSFKVKVTVSGGEACTGTVTITGFLDSTPKSETLTYEMCRYRTSSNYYTSITSITTAGLHDEAPKPNIRAVAVDGGGAEITATTWEDFSCRWEEKAVPYWNDLGAFILSDAKVLCEEAIEAGDWIRLASEGGFGHEVQAMKPATGLGGSEEFRTLLL